MQPIDPVPTQTALNRFLDADTYLHVETTNGAYAKSPFGMFARNVVARFGRATISGRGPYRVGLRLGAPAEPAAGWIYAEGLTHWQEDEAGRLLLAGHDEEGRLTVALELSLTPFPVGKR